MCLFAHTLLVETARLAVTLLSSLCMDRFGVHYPPSLGALRGVCNAILFSRKKKEQAASPNSNSWGAILSFSGREFETRQVHLFASFRVCLFVFFFFPICFENVARRELAQVHPRKFTCAGSSAWKYSVIVAARAHLRKVCVCGQIYGRCLGEIYWCNFGFICGRGFEPQQALYNLFSLPFIFVRRLLCFRFFVSLPRICILRYNV